MLKLCSLLLLCLFALPHGAWVPAPAAPTELKATAASNSSIKLTWTKSSTPGVTYTVFRDIASPVAATGTNQIASGVNTTSYTDIGLTGSRTYYYNVEAVASDGTSALAATEANATTLGAATTSESWSSLYTRAVVGGNLSAGSSLATQGNFFIEANISMPAPFQEIDQTRRLGAQPCLDALHTISLSIASAGSKASVDATDLATVQAECATFDDPSVKKDLALVAGHASSAQFERVAAEIRRNFEYDFSPMKRHVWFWINPRISAAPAQVSSLLSTVSSGNPSFDSLLKAKYDQVVQDFELHGGIEGRITKWIHLGESNRDAIYLVGSVGFDTPLASTSTNAQIFTIPTPPSTLQLSQLTNLGVGVSPSPPICTSTTTVPPACVNAVGFVPPDRTRFYYQDYLGFRLKSYYFKTKSASGEYSGLCDGRDRGQLCPIFPGTFDVTFGQNAAYSGGVAHDWLVRTELFFPLPFSPYFHIYFTTWTHLTGHNHSTLPLILDPAPTTTMLTTPGVQLVQVPELNRDFYRIGMGIDLVQLLKKLTSKPATTTTADQSTKAPGGA